MFVIIYVELKEREVKKLGEQIEKINQQLSELSLDADVVNIMIFLILLYKNYCQRNQI